MTPKFEKEKSESAQSRAVSVVEVAAELFFNFTRMGLQMALLPALPLPQPIRRAWFSSARYMTKASALFPQAVARGLNQFADDIDDLETRTSHREDLGSRLRRERRRAHRHTQT